MVEHMLFEDSLRQVDLFRELNVDELANLASRFVELFVPEDEYLFEEGDASDAFFIVRQGAVLLVRDMVGRPLQLIARLEKGAFFGEYGLFATVEHSMAAKAAAVCRILQIGKSAFLAFLDAHPAVALKLQVAAARRHRAISAAALQLGRRREVRIRLSRKARVELPDGGSSEVRLDNISPGGICLEGIPESWGVDDAVTFRLAVEGAGAVHCSGRIAWICHGKVGVAFDPSLSRGLEIEQMLQNLLILK